MLCIRPTKRSWAKRNDCGLPYGRAAGPLIEGHPWLARVRPLQLEPDDEHHLLLALGADAPPMDVFVSLDLKAFFKNHRQQWIEAELGMKVCLPSEFLAHFRSRPDMVNAT